MAWQGYGMAWHGRDIVWHGYSMAWHGRVSFGIKPGINYKMTDKHTAEYSNTANLGVYWPVCNAYIAHTTM